MTDTDTKNFNMENPDIEAELLKFQLAAQQGYKIAKQKYEEIAITLRKAEREIRETEKEQNKKIPMQSTALLVKQNEELENIRKNLIGIRENIDNLHEQEKDFSIVVFGREMAGKSTLMEILTHGNGSAIGNGKKPATKEIRSYYWNALKITDVPALDFFNTAENDKIGMMMAKTADVIIFLLTNEPPTDEEAQCLAQLKSLGKTILGVVNVKKNMTFKRQDTTIKELKKILVDNAEVDAVIEQFKNLAKNYDQDWSDIKFLTTHLAAAYRSQTEENKNPKIFSASKFEEVENFILETVKSDGRFLIIKNFVDCIAVPMNDTIMKLFEQSANSLKESKFWLKKHNDLKEWRKNFWEASQIKLHNLFMELSKNLKYEIPNFAEENYNNKDVKEEWERHVKQFGYAERYQELLGKISKECETQSKKFGDEFKQELKLNFNGKTQTNIEFEDTTPWEKYAAIVLPNLLMLVPGIGWTARVAIGVGTAFFQSFFEDKEKKVRRAKENLKKQLEESSFDTLSKINNQARDVLNKQILSNIDDFSDMLLSYSYMLVQLGESQSQIAETLLGEYNDLNEILFAEAVKYKNAGNISEMRSTIRIPGEFSAVLIEKPMLDDAALSKLLNEKFVTIKLLDNWNEILRYMLGCDFDLVTYTFNKVDVKTYSVVPKEKISPLKLKLAQQISPYPIISD